MLDPLNEVDILCVHFVFLTCSNKRFADFQGSWNFHPLSTEGNMTPLQQLAEGLAASGECDDHPEQLFVSECPGSSHNLLPDEIESVEIPSNKFGALHPALHSTAVISGPYVFM